LSAFNEYGTDFISGLASHPSPILRIPASHFSGVFHGLVYLLKDFYIEQLQYFTQWQGFFKVLKSPERMHAPSFVPAACGFIFLTVTRSHF